MSYRPKIKTSTSGTIIDFPLDAETVKGVDVVNIKLSKNSPITASTKCKITYDSNGLVTAGGNLSASDIPNLDASKITSGTIDAARLPAIAITDTFVVASQAAMLGLTAEVGDVAVRTDLNKSFILKTDGATTLSHWQELLTPTDAVSSVNGKTGAVTLSKSDVGLANVANTKITVTSSSVSDGTNTFNKYTHPSYTAQTADAYKIGRDATGHVIIGNALSSETWTFTLSDGTTVTRTVYIK